MPHSPLSGRFVRALRLAALPPGCDPSAPPALAGAGRLPSRREALRAGGVAIAGLAAARCASVVPAAGAPGGSSEVLVVGGGLAGLTAAWRLKQAGVSVRLVEADERVGGRVRSLAGRFPEGLVAELGAERIDGGDERLRALAGDLSLELDDLLVEPPGVDETVFVGGALRREAELVEAMRPVVAAARRDLAAIGGAAGAGRLGPETARALDLLPVPEWLARHGVAGWARTFVEVVLEAERGLGVGEQSCLELVLAAGGGADHPRPFGEAGGSFRVRGGNDRLATRLAEELDGALGLGTRLEALRKGSDGRLLASLRRDGTSRVERADRVVLALPFPLLREVRLDVPLSPAKRGAIAGLDHGTSSKLVTAWSRRAWRLAHGSNGTVVADTGTGVVRETSRGQKGSAGLLSSVAGGARGMAAGQGTPAERAAELAGLLDRLFPGMSAHHRPSEAVRFHWPTHPWTRGSYACYRVGQITAFGGAEDEREGGVSFAGEHTSADFQGFMEGACESGERAAREVLAAMGRTVRAPAA